MARVVDLMNLMKGYRALPGRIPFGIQPTGRRTFSEGALPPFDLSREVTGRESSSRFSWFHGFERKKVTNSRTH